MLILSPELNDLHGAIPDGKLRDLRQSRHRASRLGGCTVEVATTEPPAARLRGLLSEPAPLRRLRAMAESSGIDHSAAGAGILRIIRNGFDSAVAVFPEASAAAYSPGDPFMLRAATDEVVAWLSDRALLRPTHDVLDLGCGIGRVSGAIAPYVRFVLGLDISPRMILGHSGGTPL